jgi:hypothetical protein
MHLRFAQISSNRTLHCPQTVPPLSRLPLCIPQADSKSYRQKSPAAASFARRRWERVPAAAGGGGGGMCGSSCAAGVQGGGGGQRSRQSFVDCEFRRHGFGGGGRAGESWRMV